MVLKNDSVVKLGQLKNLESLDLSGDNVTAPGESVGPAEESGEPGSIRRQCHSSR